MTESEQERRTRILIEDLTSLLGRLSHAVLTRPENYVLHSDIAKQAGDFLRRKRKSGELPEQKILRLQGDA